MIAIGAQVRGGSKDDVVRASKYFTQGRKIAFEKWLEDPTVSLVRTFVLMAFYMFGACRRNSAFMYLGVAAKSADILGLHAASQNRHMSKAERDSRSVHPIGSTIRSRNTTQVPVRTDEPSADYESQRAYESLTSSALLYWADGPVPPNCGPSMCLPGTWSKTPARAAIVPSRYGPRTNLAPFSRQWSASLPTTAR